MQLDQEQTDKVARLWQWCKGHLPVGQWKRVAFIRDEVLNLGSVSPLISASHPNLFDAVTRDGLARTARAAWKDESLHVTPTLSGKWTLNRIVGKQWETWLPGGFAVRTLANRDESMRFDSEADAWLAAILAAPEGK